MGHSKYGRSGERSILDFLKNGNDGCFRKDLMNLYKKEGRPQNSINGQIHFMKKHHHIEERDKKIYLTWAGRHSHNEIER